MLLSLLAVALGATLVRVVLNFLPRTALSVMSKVIPVLRCATSISPTSPSKRMVLISEMVAMLVPSL